MQHCGPDSCSQTDIPQCQCQGPKQLQGVVRADVRKPSVPCSPQSSRPGLLCTAGGPAPHQCRPESAPRPAASCMHAAEQTQLSHPQSVAETSAEAFLNYSGSPSSLWQQCSRGRCHKLSCNMSALLLLIRPPSGSAPISHQAPCEGLQDTGIDSKACCKAACRCTPEEGPHLRECYCISFRDLVSIKSSPECRPEPGLPGGPPGNPPGSHTRMCDGTPQPLNVPFAPATSHPLHTEAICRPLAQDILP